jgi:hypothetical protein
MFIGKGFGAYLSSKNFLATSKQPNIYVCTDVSMDGMNVHM